MDRKNILILGSKGFLGSYLFHSLKNQTHYSVFGANRENDDCVINFSNEIQCVEQIREIAEAKVYDVIINCIAIVSSKKCQAEKDLSFLVNAKLNQIVASTFPDSKIIHISTDSVYSELPFHERGSFAIKPRTHYGLTKSIGDLILHHFSKDFHIIRCTPVGFSRSRDSFVDWIVNSAKMKKEITLFNDVLFSPVSLNQICRLIVVLVENTIEEQLINFGGKRDFTKSEFGYNLLEHLGLPTNFVRRGQALEVINDGIFNGYDQRLEYSGRSQAIRKIVNDDLINNICNDEYR